MQHPFATVEDLIAKPPPPSQSMLPYDTMNDDPYIHSHTSSSNKSHLQPSSRRSSMSSGGNGPQSVIRYIENGVMKTLTLTSPMDSPYSQNHESALGGPSSGFVGGGRMQQNHGTRHGPALTYGDALDGKQRPLQARPTPPSLPYLRHLSLLTSLFLKFPSTPVTRASDEHRLGDKNEKSHSNTATSSNSARHSKKGSRGGDGDDNEDKSRERNGRKHDGSTPLSPSSSSSTSSFSHPSTPVTTPRATSLTGSGSSGSSSMSSSSTSYFIPRTGLEESFVTTRNQLPWLQSAFATLAELEREWVYVIRGQDDDDDEEEDGPSGDLEGDEGGIGGVGLPKATVEDGRDKAGVDDDEGEDSAMDEELEHELQRVRELKDQVGEVAMKLMEDQLIEQHKVRMAVMPKPKKGGRHQGAKAGKVGGKGKVLGGLPILFLDSPPSLDASVSLFSPTRDDASDKHRSSSTRSRHDGSPDRKKGLSASASSASSPPVLIHETTFASARSSATGKSRYGSSFRKLVDSGEARPPANRIKCKAFMNKYVT